ncbi:hemin uptake protein HemP [uncultured Ferrovibrio sp.]|jgi:hemin uptake protein HemP|uniref:hemin uptake protein HemP n=1 Tax=uncultured Ferrovibrio sp. TaxID=1576913 RepID=UPI0026291828|nr:hemin uptake protein HemP [uncultured Ferrovibrio sp.]
MQENKRPAASQPAQQQAVSDRSGMPAVTRLDSRTLFRTAREVIIAHDGADYRLRLTASGKLILTK